MAPVLHALEKRASDRTLIHSRQHYSPSLDSVFFQELRLPQPDYSLEIGMEQGGHSRQIGGILIRIEPVLEEERPDVVLVQGDTNTVAAAALAASKLGIPVGHVEAGLRSYDRTMPEETNRIVTDHLSDFLFAVTPLQREILLKEGIAREKIHVVGNTVTDALMRHLHLARRSLILDNLKLDPGGYFLFTAHRSANVDYRTPLEEVAALLSALQKEFGLPILWPIHPRALKCLKQFGIHLPPGVIVCDPLGYLDFVRLEAEAKLIVTDSGGVQEEACILGVPCITIRENTERPETIEVGANVLVGRDPQKLIQAAERFCSTPREWQNPFGDGTTAEKILDIVNRRLGSAPSTVSETVSVIGMGYMGLPTACLLGTHGVPTRGVDIDAERVELINQGRTPFSEKGMDALVALAVEQGFRASTRLEPSDVYIIAVPTPVKDGQCDLSFVVRAAETVAEVARDGQLVILESTVKPNTCKQILKPLFERAGKRVLIAHCPERALPGNTLEEIVSNDRIIGGLNEEAGRGAMRIYESFTKGELLLTDATTAEIAKLIENTFRDVNIAFANELETIGREMGVNVSEAIRLANRHPRVNILQPGPGVGGHCIPIDPWFLIEGSRSARLIPTARRINDDRPRVIVEIVKRMLGDPAGKRVGILGLAYKKNVDDCRESPALKMIELLRESGALVRVFDPLVDSCSGVELVGSFGELDDWADLLVLATDHDAFAGMRLKSPLVDFRDLAACEPGAAVRPGASRKVPNRVGSA